ncbi:MAG: NRDE family protein [Agarilytica sp.]
MCTISWLVSDTGYQIFFNRDERKTRAQALPPAVIQENGVNSIMPIDPVGQGSWCAVNEHGISFALLNYYQGRLPKGHLRSRGQVVRQCASYNNLAEAKDFVRSLNHQKYPPYSLLCFCPKALSTQISMLRWNGRELIECEQVSPLISSAVKYDEVFASRINVYKSLVGNKAAQARTQDDHFSLHASHIPEKSSKSICMHREEAQTVSFSQVSVNTTDIEFLYADGPPCQAPLVKVASLSRN